MTLLGRKERPLGRKHRKERDDRRVVIATDDCYAPKQYFDAFSLTRVSVHVDATTDTRSHARHVVARLKALHADARRNNEIVDEDEFWVVLDTDHMMQGGHVATFTLALKEARDAGFRIAVTNPCFELWLLLHVADVPSGTTDADAAIEALRAALGGYAKNNVPGARLIQTVHQAIARAERLDQGASGWPQTTGTQVHILVRGLLRLSER